MTVGQDAIQVALSHSDPRDVVEAVKTAVAQEVEAVNIRRLKVRATSYFNHNYVPDLVAWWGPNDNDRREIFLRFDTVSTALAEDIRRLESDRPMFFSLTPRSVSEVADGAGGVLAALAASPHVLVTNSLAVDALIGAPDDSFEAMITTAFVQGGRGLVDSTTATLLRISGADGVDAAATTDWGRTSQAVSTVRQVLAGQAVTRVEKYLQTVWLAGGGALDDYPGDQGLALDIGPGDIVGLLRLLFKQQPVADGAFWQRLGERVDLETLADLGSVGPSGNLQALIQANLERFEVSAASADPHEPQMAFGDEAFNWRVINGLLSLDGPEFLLSFTIDGRTFRGRKSDLPLLDIATVWTRSDGLRVEGIGLDDENVIITVEAKEPDGERDAVFDVAVGGSQQVKSLHVRAAGSSMTCYFDRRVLNVDGRAPLPDVALVAAAVLTPLDPSGRGELSRFLRVGRPSGTLDLYQGSDVPGAVPSQRPTTASAGVTGPEAPASEPVPGDPVAPPESDGLPPSTTNGSSR